MDDEIITVLLEVEGSVRRLVNMAVPDSMVPDVAGRTQHTERTLTGFRRALLSEQDAPAEGAEYSIVSGGRQASRTYSLAPIAYSLMHDTGWSFSEALTALIEQGAVKLTFGWQRLQKVFDDYDLELRIVHHEIVDDGDAVGPHVGEVWTDKPMTIIPLVDKGTL